MRQFLLSNKRIFFFYIVLRLLKNLKFKLQLDIFSLSFTNETKDKSREAWTSVFLKSAITVLQSEKHITGCHRGKYPSANETFTLTIQPWNLEFSTKKNADWHLIYKRGRLRRNASEQHQQTFVERKTRKKKKKSAPPNSIQISANLRF